MEFLEFLRTATRTDRHPAAHDERFKAVAAVAASVFEERHPGDEIQEMVRK
jgi:hypothetical protein